ncbi:hypothetical protein VCSRO99_2321 [Vibrio cholerae]|nr:hypothetical protein VCSRO99_2321 [Vibrio cholerae]
MLFREHSRNDDNNNEATYGRELHFDELLEMEISKIRTSRSKPVKRMWREIEAIRDRKRLEKELLDMDVCLDADDIKI